VETVVDSFITERLKALNALFPGVKQLGIMRDTHGIYALVIQSPTGRQYYFAAKNSMKGGVISVHKSLLTDAMRFRKPIILGIREDFYRFNPYIIKRKAAFENVYHGAQMVNFPITLGVDLLKAEKQANRAPEPTLFELPKPKRTFTDDGKEIIRALQEIFGAEEIDDA